MDVLSRNLWSRFVKMTGSGTYQTVGECVAARFGSCTVALPGGTQIEVQGAGTVGTRYFVEDGKLAGEAPDLPLLEIEV